MIEWKVTKENEKYWYLLDIKPKYKITQKVIDRFFSYFREGEKNECWLWNGNLDDRNYGAFSLKGKQFKAHRVSFAFYNGFLDFDLHCCHSCDNPSCINPLHLWLGTDADNMQDKCKKGRIKTGRCFGELNSSNKLSCENVLFIKKVYKSRKITQKKLAEKFGVSRSLINAILTNKIWKDLTEDNITNYSRIGVDFAHVDG